jgi:hypothetical protein
MIRVSLFHSFAIISLPQGRSMRLERLPGVRAENAFHNTCIEV